MSNGSLTLDQYINHRISQMASTVGELYGTENFCHFLYRIVHP